MKKKTLTTMLTGLLCISISLALTACGESAETNKTEEPTFEIEPLVGEAWDYSDKNNWMFFDNNDDIDHDVDVFFLYPTSVSTTVEEEVCDSIDDMSRNARKSYIQSAYTLSSFTNMYAPYYRQVSAVGILNNPTADGFLEAVFNNVTRTDVYAALDYYFENCNNGKPYILAGHSQGSCNLKIVLSEYMKIHPEYLENLVACYAIGYYFPDRWFEENPQIKPAAGETDTGVLITWNTEGPGGTKSNLPLGNNDGFCINPLNWKTDETPADVSLNKGSIFVNFASNESAGVTENIESEVLNNAMVFDDIVAEQTDGVSDATIDLERGALVTTTYTSYIPDNPIFGDKSCHLEDWALFTVNIRENAQKRIEAFMNK